MSRFATFSRQPPIMEELVDEDFIPDISNDRLKKSIVLSMSAADEDWQNYKRRASGGSAVTLFHQSRNGSRRTSRDDSSLHTAPMEGTISDPNGNYEKDMTCEDLLAFVKLKLDSVMADSDLENEINSIQDAPKREPLRQRRHGTLITRRIPIQKISSPPGEKIKRSVSNPGDSDHHLDITGQTNESRYPWLRDAATQCDLLTSTSSPTNTRKVPTIELNESYYPPQSDDRTPQGLAQNPRSPYTTRSTRLQSTNSIYSINELPFINAQGSTTPRGSTSPRNGSEYNDGLDLEGKVILEPDVLQHTFEFYSEQAAQEEGSGDEGTEMKGYDRSRRRACVVTTLDLGESVDPEDDREGSKKYPGDLVLHNGHALRQGSPSSSMTTSDKQINHYGSEGSLIDTNSSSSNSSNGFTIPPVAQATEKHTKTQKKNSFLNRVLRSHRREPESLESFLHNLKPTDFKDERIASLRHQHWRELLTSRGEDCDDISNKEASRRDAVWEIFTSECVFLVDHLMVLKHVFMEPLKKCQVEDLLMEVDPNKLFGNLDNLCHLSLSFCRDFVNEMKSWSADDFGSTDCLCDCLDRMTVNSRDGDTYHQYVLKYRSAITYLDNLRDTVEDFSTYERFCEHNPKLNKLGLKDIMVAPMHHWTRLPLILKRLRDRTESGEEIERLDQTVNKVVASLKVLDNKMEWLKTFERVKEIQDQLIWPTFSELDNKALVPESLRSLVLMPPSDNLLADQIREVCYEGPLIYTERDKTLDVYVFLFTDILLITRIKKKARGRQSTIEKMEGLYQIIRQPLSIDSLWIHDIGQTEASSTNMKNMFVISQRNIFQQVTALYTFQAHTQLGKQQWLQSLRGAKDRLTELNNNGGLAPSRHESFKKMLNMDDHTSLLKNSQVLPLTTSTQLRAPVHTNSLGRPKPKGTEAFNRRSDNDECLMRNRQTRTMSAGCLNGELRTLRSHFNSEEYIH